MYPDNDIEQFQKDAVARNEALHNISRSLAEQENLTAVLQKIVDIAASVMGANQVTIHNFDLVQQKVELIVQGGPGASDHINAVFPISGLSDGSFEDARSSYGKTKITEHSSHPDHYLWSGNLGEPAPWTVITVPIIFCERIFGILKASNPANHAPFPKTDESFIISLANLAALAIENERIKRSERQQRRQADTLREVAQILNFTLDQQQVLELILDQIARVVEYDSASIMLISEQKVRLVVNRISRGAEEINIPERIHAFPHLLEVLERRRPIIINDTLQDSRWQALQKSSIVRCWLGVPLIGRDQVIGLLNLNKEQPGYYSQQDAALAVTFASQAAIAIENARLYTAERNRGEQLDALRATIVDISTELNLPRLLQAILQRAVRLVNATGGDLGLFDEVRGEIQIAASYNLGRNYTGMRIKVGEDALGQAVLHRRPVIVEDYAHWDMASSQYKNDIWQTVLAVPFIIGRRIAGAFGIVDQEPTRRFTASDQQLISHLAQHAAIAVENARLYQSAREAAERRATLHQVSQAIVAASLQPEEIYSAIYDATARLMQVEAFFIVCKEGDSQHFKPVYHMDQSELDPVQSGPGECGLSNLVISTGQSIYIPTTSESKLTSDIIPLNEPGKVSSVLAVSMRLRGKVVGMIAVQSFQPEAYSSDDISLLEMLASYAAIALDNAALFQSIQKLAITDPLTGVHNRRHLYDLGQREFQRAKRFKRPLSALMVDIDRFKSVNDQYGHATGDAVLLRLSGLLKTGVREFDIVGRYGGEEFVIILPETALAATCEVAERLRTLVSNAFENTDVPKITVSIGVAACQAETSDLDALVQIADVAMYAAKKLGGNRVALA